MVTWTWTFYSWKSCDYWCPWSFDKGSLSDLELPLFLSFDIKSHLISDCWKKVACRLRFIEFSWSFLLVTLSEPGVLVVFLEYWLLVGVLDQKALIAWLKSQRYPARYFFLLIASTPNIFRSEACSVFLIDDGLASSRCSFEAGTEFGRVWHTTSWPIEFDELNQTRSQQPRIRIFFYWF